MEPDVDVNSILAELHDSSIELDRLREALNKIAYCCIIPPMMTEQARQLMRWQDIARDAVGYGKLQG